MKLVLLIFLVPSVLTVNLQNGNKPVHPYEFVRAGNSRANDVGSKPNQPGHFNRLKPTSQNVGGDSTIKATNRVPPYAVLMEPLVKYSQPDPLYDESKDAVSKTKNAGSKKFKVNVKKEDAKDNAKIQTEISAKSGQFASYEDSEVQASHNLPVIEYTAPGVLYEEPPPREPEPIIEIIIKESNQSLPTPPPPPPPPKKKKEHVQVFYVKYKKDPSALYGEEKIVYDPPVPAVTPPTNNADNHEEEEEEYSHHHHHHQEEVTLPPRPSTTLKAIIKPDSETYHGHGVRITFGRPLPEESGHGGGHGGGGHGSSYGGGHGSGEDHHSHHHHHHHHRGDYEEQSAPKPSVVLPPPKNKVTVGSRTRSESLLTKRNPAPFHSATQPPQQSFHSSHPITSPRDFPRPTPLPTFQQTPQFPAQQFQPQLPKLQPSSPSLLPTSSKPSPSLRYSTLPQHLQQLPKVQQGLSFPLSRQNPPQHPPQPSPQPAVTGQQYYSINQPHLKSSFHVNIKPNPPQYQTISNQASRQHSSISKTQQFPQTAPPPVFHQPTKLLSQQPAHPSFPQPSSSFPQPANSFPPPSNTFSQVPQRVLGPIIQTHPAPILPPQNSFISRTIFPQQPVQPPQVHQKSHQVHQPPPQPQLRQSHQPQPQFHQPHQPQPQPQLHQSHQNQLQLHQNQPQLHQSHQPQPQLHQSHQSHQSHQLHQQQISQAHQHQVEQLNRLQQQQQRLQTQILDQQKQFFNQQKIQTTYAPEIIRSVSPDLPFANHRFETRKPQFHATTRSQFPQTVKPNVQFSAHKNIATTTESFKKYTTTTEKPVEYATQDPKKAEEERRKKEERKKANVAALPKEVPDDLREQLLSSDILGNADIQILDYDKIGDIPIESLPPEALANFQAVAGSAPVPSIVKPNTKLDDPIAEGSEQSSVVVPPNGPVGDLMEMKVVRYNPDSKEGAQVPSQYVKEGATQLEPVVLNDSKYNRYLPLKVSGAQFPVPDVPELRGKNVTSVVVLAPVDYEFLQRHEDVVDDSRAGRRSSHPVLEVQGVHFVAGDVLKTLVKTPTSENYRKWLEKENSTALDKQSVVLLVIDPANNQTSSQEKEIFMYDIGTRKVSKLSGELSAQFVEVAESNSENEDLDEISDGSGGDFTVKDASGVAPAHFRTQRKASGATSQSKVLPR